MGKTLLVLFVVLISMSLVLADQDTYFHIRGNSAFSDTQRYECRPGYDMDTYPDLTIVWFCEGVTGGVKIPPEDDSTWCNEGQTEEGLADLVEAGCGDLYDVDDVWFEKRRFGLGAYYKCVGDPTTYGPSWCHVRNTPDPGPTPQTGHYYLSYRRDNPAEPTVTDYECTTVYDASQVPSNYYDCTGISACGLETTDNWCNRFGGSIESRCEQMAYYYCTDNGSTVWGKFLGRRAFDDVYECSVTCSHHSVAQGHFACELNDTNEGWPTPTENCPYLLCMPGCDCWPGCIWDCFLGDCTCDG